MAQTPSTWDDYVGDGVEDTFQVTFPYQKQSEVFVTVDGDPAAFTFISAGWIRLAAAPANGATIRVQRSTEAFEPRHEFANGVPLLPRFIDENNKQFLYVAQEAVNETAGTAAAALALAERTAELVGDTGLVSLGNYTGGLVFTRYNEYMARGGFFYRPAPGSLPFTTTGTWDGADGNLFVLFSQDDVLRQDLANSSDAAKGAALVGYKNRNLRQRADDEINVRDFDSTGGSNWDAAFIAADAAAAAKGSRVFVPAFSGEYALGNITINSDFYSDGAVIKRRAGTTGNWITVGSDSVKIKGFNFDGAAIEHNCISIESKSDCEVKNNVFINIRGYCVHFNGAIGLNISRNKVTSCWQGFSNVMPVDSVSALPSRTVTINDNEIENIAGSAVYLAGELSSTDPYFFKSNLLVTDVSVSGNKIRSVSGNGIIGQARCLVIANNNLRDCGNAAGRQSIVPQGIQVSVLGNTVQGGAGVGIDMGLVTTGTVSGNTVVGCGQIGIEVQSCIGLTVTGNTVEECGSLESGNASSGISIAQGFFGPSNNSFAVTVSGNVVRSGPNPGRFGISVGAGISGLIVTGNHIINSGTVSPFYIDPTAQALIYGNLEGSGEEGLMITRSTATAAKQVTRGPTGDNDHWLNPTGTGQLRVEKFLGTAATPGNFSAQSYLPIKDQAGNIFYIPARTSTW